MASAKTAKANENQANAIVLQSGMSLEDLNRELAPFMESVNQQFESEDPAIQESAAMAAQKAIGEVMLATGPEALASRDRVAELYFAYGDLAARIRRAVQQAEAMARRQERFAEIIRSNIESLMLTSWDAKRITGAYREFRITKNPDKVMVLDEAQIPAEYFDPVPATKVLNKTRLAEALKEREAVRQAAIKDAKVSEEDMNEIIKKTDIPGAILETNRTRLDIK